MSVKLSADTLVFALQQTYLFSLYSVADLKEIIALSQVVIFKKDEVLFEPSTITNRFYIIIQGNVVILSEEKNSTLAEFVTGELVGELNFLKKSKAGVYAIALTDTYTLEFPRGGAALEELLAHNLHLYVLLLKSFLLLIAQRTRDANLVIKENNPIIRELRNQVYGDNLTGLLNRAYLEENLADFLKGPVSLIMVKPDNFKDINDTFGHEMGDATLRWIGRHLPDAVPKDSVLVRYQGNEFAVLTPGQTREEARATAKDIKFFLETLDLSSVLYSQALLLKVSIGIALYPEHATDAQSLIQACAELPLVSRYRGGGLILFPEDGGSEN